MYSFYKFSGVGFRYIFILGILLGSELRLVYKLCGSIDAHPTPHTFLATRLAWRSPRHPKPHAMKFVVSNFKVALEMQIKDAKVIYVSKVKISDIRSLHHAHY